MHVGTELKVQTIGQCAAADLEGFLPLRFQETSPEDLMEDVLKLNFFEDSATPLFCSGGSSLPGHTG